MTDDQMQVVLSQQTIDAVRERLALFVLIVLANSGALGVWLRTFARRSFGDGVYRDDHVVYSG